ncbi:MAG: DNA polymerase III subunit chi [Rhizobiaceae bacterium]|nr:DNA polymerase III subunit chi [Rhizobiaceae bacterium]MCV0406459.1 DNA polymerase III subunit chi [Rhizobiaceae bacterium]
MAEVWFYHLTDSTLEGVLPDLLERSLSRGWRAVIQAGAEERRDALDSHLWTYRDRSFLAHGTDREPHVEHQPIVLTTGPANPNGATVRFMVDGAGPTPHMDDYERIVFMFDGHDADQLSAARVEWKRLKTSGVAVSYWRQNEGGRWEKQA